MSSCESTTYSSKETLLLEARIRPSGDALDLLFVLNSTWGYERTQDLTSMVPMLIEEIFASENERQRVVDLHVGVTDMDIGAGGYERVYCNNPSYGALQVSEVCQHRYDISGLPFWSFRVDDESGEQPSEDEVTMATYALHCAAALDGPYGCELEQPLESLRLALTDRVDDGTNAGFFREGAVLAVVIATDEDDCSTRDPSFFDPNLDDLAELGYIGLRCFANADQLEPVAPYAELLLAQRPPGRVVTAGWLTVPQGWDGDLEVLRHDPGLDWRRAESEDFEICREIYHGMIRSPRLGEFMVLTGGADLVWSMCDNSVYVEGMPAIGGRIRERLDPVACLPFAPPPNSRCEVELHLLDGSDECPEATEEATSGECELTDDQWELIETDECTELRASPEIEVPLGAWLEIRCYGHRFSAR